jgi:hypothetical protein
MEGIYLLRNKYFREFIFCKIFGLTPTASERNDQYELLGLWRTVTMNLNKVIDISKGYNWLEEDDRKIVISRIQDLLGIIAATQKSPKWNLRSKIGDKMKWSKMSVKFPNNSIGVNHEGSTLLDGICLTR